MKLILIGVAALLCGWCVYYFSTANQRGEDARKDDKDMILSVSVDYSLPLEAMLKAGQYPFEEVGPKVLEAHAALPRQGRQSFRLHLINLSAPPQWKNADSALSYLKSRGLEPAGIEHLIALHREHPDFRLDNQSLIWALASQWTAPGAERPMVATLELTGDKKRSGKTGKLTYSDAESIAKPGTWLAAVPEADAKL